MWRFQKVATSEAARRSAGARLIEHPPGERLGALVARRFTGLAHYGAARPLFAPRARAYI
ncbi:MAG: hypothetical protein AAF486_05430 [Pseudomonadota bacterium]